MKKYIFTIIYIVICLLNFSCKESSLSPSLDLSPEYDILLSKQASQSEVDAKIYNIYKTYHMAILYKFTQKEFEWGWASKVYKSFVPIDFSKEEDQEALANMVKYIETYLLKAYPEDFLKKNLPYRIFLSKELHSGSSIETSYINSYYNEQDAIMLGYMSSEKKSYSESKFRDNLAAEFAKIFFENLSVKPTKFFAAVPKLKWNLVSAPEDPVLQAAQKQFPDFVDKSDFTQKNMHSANVIGFIRGKNNTVMRPTDAQDYADFLAFITNNPGSYIRQRTLYYPRLALRGKLFLEYILNTQKEDLIAIQNKAFPTDKLDLTDFNHPLNK